MVVSKQSSSKGNNNNLLYRPNCIFGPLSLTKISIWLFIFSHFWWFLFQIHVKEVLNFFSISSFMSQICVKRGLLSNLGPFMCQRSVKWIFFSFRSFMLKNVHSGAAKRPKMQFGHNYNYVFGTAYEIVLLLKANKHQWTTK